MQAARYSVISRARASFSTTENVSPASGAHVEAEHFHRHARAGFFDSCSPRR
jgi:hypothetical protein